MKKKSKPAFSFKKDGPIVEDMYCNDNMLVSQIAKNLGRAYTTIKNYLEYKGLYTGATTGIAIKSFVPDTHISGQRYYHTKLKLIVTFKHYYKNACLIWLHHPEYLYYAYCEKTELTQQGD